MVDVCLCFRSKTARHDLLSHVVLQSCLYSAVYTKLRSDARSSPSPLPLSLPESRCDSSLTAASFAVVGSRRVRATCAMSSASCDMAALEWRSPKSGFVHGKGGEKVCTCSSAKLRSGRSKKRPEPGVCAGGCSDASSGWKAGCTQLASAPLSLSREVREGEVASSA